MLYDKSFSFIHLNLRWEIHSLFDYINSSLIKPNNLTIDVIHSTKKPSDQFKNINIEDLSFDIYQRSHSQSLTQLVVDFFFQK